MGGGSAGGAEALSPHLHGARWVSEEQDRQALLGRLQSESVHFRERLVALALSRRRERTLVAVWGGWNGLVSAARRRQIERLTKLAGALGVDGGTSPPGSATGAEAALSKPSLNKHSPYMHTHAHAPRGPLGAPLALADVSEWWERSPKAKRKPKGGALSKGARGGRAAARAITGAPIDVSTMV